MHTRLAMRLLVLGGTRFVGRGVVEAAAARGHVVSLLHRGLEAKDAYPEHEHLLADRTRPETLGILGGRNWDAVIDVSGYEPDDVRRVGTMLEGSVGRYLFVSTAAVHRGDWGAQWDEETPLVDAEEDSYAGRKRRCEDLLRQTYGKRCTILRPSIIVGPNDPDDRLGHWVRRACRGGEALAPGRPDQPLQFVDRDDFGRLVVRCVEEAIEGPALVAGPPMRSDAFFEACARATGGKTSFRFVSGAALAEAGLRAEDFPGHLPYWSPADDLASVLDVRRAWSQGVSPIPLVASIEKVIGHASSRYLDEAREAELLERLAGPLRDRGIVR